MGKNWKKNAKNNRKKKQNEEVQDVIQDLNEIKDDPPNDDMTKKLIYESIKLLTPVVGITRENRNTIRLSLIKILRKTPQLIKAELDRDKYIKEKTGNRQAKSKKPTVLGLLIEKDQLAIVKTISGLYIYDENDNDKYAKIVSKHIENLREQGKKKRADLWEKQILIPHERPPPRKPKKVKVTKRIVKTKHVDPYYKDPARQQRQIEIQTQNGTKKKKKEKKKLKL